MPPRTRSSGAPRDNHQHVARDRKEPPRTPAKRSLEDDDLESERDKKRPHTEPRSLPIFQRNQSYIARNRARWQQTSQTVRAPRFVDRPETPILKPTSTETVPTDVRPSIETEVDQQRPAAQPRSKTSALSWLMSIPARLFSPTPARMKPFPPQRTPPEQSPSSPPEHRHTLRTPSPELADDTYDAPDPSPQRTPSSTAQVRKKRRFDQVNHKSPREEPDEVDLVTEQINGSRKRRIAASTFELNYSDEEDDAAAVPTPSQQLMKTPLKSAFRSTIGSTGRKTLRINETPTNIRRLYGHYGPAGEYRGSTFADSSNNTFSKAESATAKNTTTNDSLTTSTREVQHDAPTTVRPPFGANIFSTSKPFVQPNTFSVPDDDDDDSDNDSTPPAAAPAAPRMSHAELPDPSQSTENSDPSVRKESEEAALRKAREQAQKYKPKTSSRLSTVAEKSRSRSSSPPASTTADVIIAADAAQETGLGPYDEPYPWSKPPRPSTSKSDPNYEAWSFDDVHVGPDGLTDRQRRTARDQVADKWVAENVQWTAPSTYVEAGLCSEYIDSLVRKEASEEGLKRASDFYDRQFEDVLRWAESEQTKGHTVGLSWDNGRQELVW